MNKKTLIDRLNEDLAGELAAMTQYIAYSAKANGPFRLQLSQFFADEVADEQGHAQFLANKIAALGGEPTTRAREVAVASTNKEMVEEVLKAERRAIADYTQRVKDAEEAGEKGLAIQLEDIVADETGHAEESARVLEGWPL